MSDNTQDSSRDGRQGKTEDRSSSYVGYGVAAGVAALAGGLYWLTSGRQSASSQHSNTRPAPAQQSSQRQQNQTSQRQPQTTETDSVSNYLANLINRMASPNSARRGYDKPHFQSGVRGGSPPKNPCISNLNALLSDIYVRYVQIKCDDFQLHYAVFDKIFQHLHQKMKEVDPYYGNYSSTVQFAGSHFDNLRIKKPDEFDMDIIIDLPLNLKENPGNPAESDIVIEPKSAGFVQLKMGLQFQRLPMRDGNNWQINKAAYEWMDGSHYLLRSKFLDWFKGVVNKALNQFQMVNCCPIFYVDGVQYTIGKSESGPAMTLIIENKNRGFKLDVDLVPALKFPEERWPIGPSYRRIPAQCARGHWMLVGKTVRNGVPHDERRSWRIALHNQERDLMYNKGNFKQALRLVKKLRDALGLKKIASYYVKTLFFWEIDERDHSFWKKTSPADLFKLMVGRLHSALVNKNIPYFWNRRNNLIGNVREQVLFEYAAKLVPLMQVLELPGRYKEVAKYLLTAEEFNEYNANILRL